ncbi:bifunctional glutamate N-acetyltransferase/amino-acid acetyltransferase ArgJ [Candidatus Poriferisocius sp.]|uniref:bifunctional glutamate N-acetyltransferase/amino-acid acetyltransferase ArgJ n=1 Tax=Candidatus Poriferisocius sp. TaxID=3101276 RepID=UPI003B01CE76
MSVTAVNGFSAAGVACGIKPGGALDLALVATTDGDPVSAAGVFTSNKMTAAPVLVCREHLVASGGKAAAVVLNSGNANAATGVRGMADARRMCTETAAALGVAPEEVLVCSTGLIGYNLPMDAVSAGITAAARARNPNGGPQAAEAIMTTDTVTKQVVIAGDGFTVAGMAKGAAMLEPNMATMLAVLVTDAATDPATLRHALAAGVAGTFNTLTVDGAESTNDTVLMLANGRAGPVDPEALTPVVAAACENLALQMADDAEGSTKTVFLRVTGAATHAEAAKAARDTANCQLVKCSWYGQDPYWGRIASEMGAAGVAFDHTRLTIAYGPHVVYDRGEPAHPPELARYMTGRHLDLHVDLGLGDGEARVITTDLTHAYIDENMGTS